MSHRTSSLVATLTTLTVLSVHGLLFAQNAPTRSVQPRAAAQQQVQQQQPAQQGPKADRARALERFRLSPEEQRALDRFLASWEQHSSGIESLKCDVYRWENDLVFGKKTQSKGELKYRAPDKGLYRVEDENKATTEHWVCDGQSIFEFNYENKQLIERRLPPELQGKAIANGPLPFLFGAQADDLKRRYYMRLVQPPAGHEDKICIEAAPKLREEAANFERAEFMLDGKTWLPFALQLEMANGNTTTHLFSNVTVNSKFDWLQGDFAKPRTPFGWTRIVDPQPSDADLQEARQTVPVPQRN